MATASPASTQAAATATLPPAAPGPVLRRVLLLSRDPLAYFTQLQRTVGDAVTVDLARGGRLYLFSTPAAVERLLVGHAANYTSREVNQPSMPFLGDGLLNIDAEAHRQQRALVQPAFARRRVEAYAPVILAHAEDMLRTWREGAVVDMHRQMQRLTLRIVARALFGIDLAAEGETLGGAFTEVIGYDFQAPLQIRINAPFTAWGRYQRADALLGRWVHGQIDARRGGTDRGDVFSTLLGVQAAQASDGEPAGAPVLDDRQVRDHAMTLLAAGHETTANALTFALYLLSGSPQRRARLADELARALGGRPPSVEDLAQLPYLDAVVKESLRLFPPAWVIGRHAIADDELAGFRLPAGGVALVSQWVIHRLAAFWPEPDRFLPERWLSAAEGGQQVTPFAYFPFGGGVRTCIGMPFALLEAKLILATLLQRFVPDLVPGQRLRLQAVVTLRPRAGMRMRLQRAA